MSPLATEIASEAVAEPMAEQSLQIEVVYAAATQPLVHVQMRLPVGATLRDAVLASGVLSGLAAGMADQLQPGVWGRVQAWDHRLRDRDRVELYRPLTVDPKEARRQRYQRDGLKRAPRTPVKR